MRILAFILLLSTCLILLIIGIFFNSYFQQIAQLIQTNFWPSIIAMLTFFGLAAGGVIRNPPRSFNQFLANKYLQSAGLILFLFSLSILIYIAKTERNGVIHIVLKSKSEVQLRAKLTRYGDSITSEEIFVPQKLFLQRGKYSVKLLDDNYKLFEHQVDVRPGKEETITMNDDVVQPFFTFYLSPSNVEAVGLPVQFTHISFENIENSKSVSISESITLTQLGAYKIRLSDKSYLPWDTILLVSALTKKDYKIKIRTVKRTGRITVETTPPGAGVFLEGQRIGTTPHFSDLSLGKYSVVIRKNGFADVDTTADLTETNLHPVIRISLVELVKVDFICESPNTEFIVNGTRYKGEQRNVTIPKGGYEIRSKSPGMEERKQTIRIENNNQSIFISI